MKKNLKENSTNVKKKGTIIAIVCVLLICVGAAVIINKANAIETEQEYCIAAYDRFFADPDTGEIERTSSYTNVFEVLWTHRLHYIAPARDMGDMYYTNTDLFKGMDWSPTVYNFTCAEDLYTYSNADYILGLNSTRLEAVRWFVLNMWTDTSGSNSEEISEEIRNNIKAIVGEEIECSDFELKVANQVILRALKSGASNLDEKFEDIRNANEELTIEKANVPGHYYSVSEDLQKYCNAYLEQIELILDRKEPTKGIKNNEIPSVRIDKTRAEQKNEDNYYLFGPYKIIADENSYDTTITVLTGGLVDVANSSGTKIANNIVDCNKDFYIKWEKSSDKNISDFSVMLRINKKKIITDANLYYNEYELKLDDLNKKPVLGVKKELYEGTSTSYIYIDVKNEETTTPGGSSGNTSGGTSGGSSGSTSGGTGTTTPTTKGSDLVVTQEILSIGGTNHATDNYEIALQSSTYNSNDFRYSSIKSAVEASAGSEVTYRITVYNEGDEDGYFKELTLYLRDELEYTKITVPSKESKVGNILYKYGADIEVDDSDKNAIKFKFNYSNKGQLLEAYNTSDGMKAYYIDVTCKISEDLTERRHLTSRTEITEYGSNTSEFDSKDILYFDTTKAFIDKYGLTVYYSDGSKSNITTKEDKNTYDGQDDNDFVILFVEGTEKEETYVDFVLAQEVLKIDGNEDGCKTDNYNIEKTSNKFTYKANKKACEVKPGSEITYRATVYNEGNKDGYLNEITIYLPDGLEYTGISKPTEEAVNTLNANNTNISYKYGADIEVDDSNKKIIKIQFNQENETKGQLLEAYNTSDKMKAYYIDVICNVTEDINNNTVLTSRAEISDYASLNSENIYTRTSMDDEKAIYEVDKDSCGYTKFNTLDGYLSHIETVNNIKLNDLDTKGELDKSKYDNQDDDDFSRIIVKKGITDLVLTQEILSIDGEAYDIDNYEVTLESDGFTDLTYKSNKKTVEVKKGSTIKYRITAYNESEVTGYVSKIKIYLSEDLNFDKNASEAIIISNPESEIINYRTGAKVEVLEYVEENNIITIGINVDNTNPGPGQELLGKKDNKLEAFCIDIMCTVDENAQNDEILSCVAEIKEYAAYGNNGYYNKVKDTDDNQVDRDSNSYSFFDSVDTYFEMLNIDFDNAFKEDTFKLWKKWYDIQDDDDFARVKVKVPKLDVSLTKSILRYSVEGLEIDAIERNSIRKNQYRVSKTTESEGLKANDYIVYGVDIYNEGEIEAGVYEIIEYVPEGLKLTGVKLSGADENFKTYTNEQEYEEDTTSNCYYYDEVNKKAYIKLAGLGEAGLLDIYDGNIINFENNKLRIEVTCEVTENAPQATEIVSITEISKYITKSGEWIETIEGIEKTQDKIIDKDMDSTGKTLEDNLETYKEYVASAKPFIIRPMSEDTENPINEDDQDYAEIIITSYTDLALRCFITSVGDTEYDRKPTNVIDARSSANLMKYKTIMYSNTKKPLQVTVGDTITYTIRVYNEGYKQAEATEIKYYIPQGLEIIDVSGHDENCTCTNCTYSWEIHETTESGVTIAKSRYLEGKTLDKTGASGIARLYSIIASLVSTTGTADERYISYINETKDAIPFYRDVQIQCRVTEEIYNKGTAYLGSIAEISEYKSKDGQTDFDSKANDLLDNRTYEQMEENVIGLSQSEDSFDSIYYYFNQVRYNLYDDTDFEVIQVPEKLPIKLQLIQVDAEDSENKINGEKFKIGQKEYTTQTINNNKGIIEMNSEVYKKTTYAYTISEIATQNTSVLAELENDLRLRVQVGLNENHEFEVEKIILNEIVNGEEMNNPLSANLTSHSAIVKAKLTDGTSILVKAEYDELAGTIKLLVPNRVKKFDLSLQNFVTEIGKEETNTQENQTTSENSQQSVEVNYTKVTGREPKFTIDENGKYVYNSANTAEPLEVSNGDIVVYTIRVYNEGEIDGYVEEIMNEIPENLQFLPNNNINTQYGWKMYREVSEEEQVTNKNADSKTLTIGDATLSYIEYNGKTYVETENAELADYVVTTYLSQANGTAEENQENTNLINYFDIAKYNDGKISGPSYKDVKIAFKVIDPGESREITNNAQITKYKAIDRQGNETEMNDSDSTPNVWEQGSRADDQGTEKIKVLGFDLSLKKCVTSAIIIDNGKQTIYEGNKNPDEEKQIIKVDIPKNKIDDVSLKFKYTIRVYNEGDIAGFAKEITEYIPQGLRFDSSEQTNITYGWTDDGDGKVTTDYLANKELKTGEYADIEIVLAWINGENNMNLKTNIAEISEAYNNYNNTPDKDSTPNNLELEEDDIDTAEVLIAPRTGTSINTMYIVLAVAVVALITTGTILIRKFVISKN